MRVRTPAPAPAPSSSTSSSAHSDPWLLDSSAHFDSSKISSVMKPAARSRAGSLSSAPLTRSASEPESFIDTSLSFTLPQGSTPLPLPDPASFPDPYPFRHPHHHLTSTTSTLSSAGSSSASTRSSAYTNPGSTISSSFASGDYGHVRVALGDGEDGQIGVGITADTVVELLSRDPLISSGPRKSRAPVERFRRSDYTSSSRSRSSSDENVYGKTHAMQDVPMPPLRHQTSYDMSWQQTVDERDELGVTSEEDTDYGEHHDDESGDELDPHREEERTSAVVVAEEGRGLIVQGDGLPVAQLQIHPGTTHLLIGGSSTPNSLPSFLSSTLPQISTSLLALDISANFLASLPPALASCSSLEELNIASNPLRAVPIFLAHLTSLRVLIADSTGLTTLPYPLSALEKLHTLSIRRNKLNSLPSWLCLLPCLESLLVDANSFQGPWKALVEPLLAKTPMTPMYPPSTPMFPQLSAALSSSAGTDTEQSDAEDQGNESRSFSNPPSAGQDGRFTTALDEEHTITAAHAPLLARSTTSPAPAMFPQQLTRTRTTPNRSFYDRSRTPSYVLSTPESQSSTTSTAPLPAPTEGADKSSRVNDSGYFSSRQVRRMRSAGEIRRAADTRSPSEFSTPQRPTLSHYATSVSSSNLLGTRTLEEPTELLPQIPQRFASLGVTSRTPSRTTSRSGVVNSMWNDHSVDEEADADIESPSRPISRARGTSPLPRKDRDSRTEELERIGRDQVTPLKPKVAGEKERPAARRWGFLKKMSMGKMKSDSSSTPARSMSRPSTAQGRFASAPSTPSLGRTNDVLLSGVPRLAVPSIIDLDLSDSASAFASQSPSPTPVLSTPVTSKLAGTTDALKAPSQSPTGLLGVPTPTGRSAKRRSFLPIDGLPSLNIPIPSISHFLPGLTATNGADDIDHGTAQSPTIVESPVEAEVKERQEQEKIREANARALRSVMAYLKDMNDLTTSNQNNAMSVYGMTSPSMQERPRRATIGESGRVQSDSSIASNDYSSSIPSVPSSSHLRSPESTAGNRSGSSSATMSVATTDSNGSGSEDRKYKEDASKRTMVIREIIETERTYVKSLQELVDIYIKPASLPVNMIGSVSVSSSKETVVPAAERKIVFGGLESLFSFHKESFLPALESAAAPLLRSAKKFTDSEAERRTTSEVAMAVGNAFVNHAAFMKMYSTYINNFDNSVQRVRQWVTDRDQRPGTSSGPATTVAAASSTAQLVALGLSMSTVGTPGVQPDSNPTMRNAALTSGQRKRIKAYLKRCRINPRHSQLNLEGYLLLPVQRIPRYRLLLEELVRSTPPDPDIFDDPLDKALTEISSLATNMNEGKREAESRRKLVHWQSKIRGKFPSPLVQPHRRLIMDGRLRLTRVVRKQTMAFEVLTSQGDTSNVQVECLAPELTPRPLVGILCNDLLVLCRDPSDGQDPNSPVDLWAVLRMQTLPQPASIVHGNALRIVDNKAILYFELPSTSEALTWFRAINLHIPSSKS
ncbi:hypothetical protein BD410DRAFT_737533 [Rickenella mellea]|uniref:DH domain-containing protein n=1 Tax=Rickenella mellea TaxID=50990 RepID=A0A4Y7QN70_9AGAM|nr:hypothetical protein BD410DRAFT_737533 [Rickenella mellea]